MKTLSEIRNILFQIADTNKMEGLSTILLVELLSNAIYNNQLITINTSLESSLSRSTQLNSRITLAGDLGYSVFRGSNQKIKFAQNALRYINTTPLSVKKYDVLMEYNALKLVYADDYSFSYNFSDAIVEDDTFMSNAYQVDCIVAKNIGTETKTIQSNEKMIVYFPIENISNDLQVYINGNRVVHQEGLYYNAENPDAKVSVITMSGFGVFIVNREINGNYAFTSGDVVRIDYIEYCDEDIDFSLIKSVPNFNYSSSVGYTTTPVIERESNIDQIYYNALSYFRNSQEVKSDYDLVTVVNSYFDKYIESSKLVKSYDQIKYGTLVVPKMTTSRNSFKITAGDNITVENSSGVAIDLNSGKYKLNASVSISTPTDVKIVYETSVNSYRAEINKELDGTYTYSINDSSEGVQLSGVIDSLGMVYLNGFTPVNGKYTIPSGRLMIYFTSNIDTYSVTFDDSIFSVSNFRIRDWNYPSTDSKGWKAVSGSKIEFKRTESDQIIVFKSVSTSNPNKLTYTAEEGSTGIKNKYNFDYKLGNLLNLNAYAIFKSGITPGSISTEIDKFRSNIREVYYIRNAYFTMTEATELSNKINLPLEIHYSYNYPLSIVETKLNNLLNSYRYVIGEDINLYELIGKIQAINEVNYVRVTDTTVLDNSVISIGSSEYPSFDLSNITFVAERS